MAATCSAANVDFVRSLGAELVIDYGKEDFTRRPERYDVILDAVAKSSFAECRPLLLPGGTYVTTVPGPDLLAWAGWGYLAGLLGPTRKARFILVSRRGEFSRSAIRMRRSHHRRRRTRYLERPPIQPFSACE